MTTYAQLQTDVAAWIVRDDLAAQIPSFIRLAEARINRAVRVMAMETDATWLVDSTGEYTLPDGFLGFRHVAVNDAVTPHAEYLPPDKFTERKLASTFGYLLKQGGPSIVYTVESSKLKVSPAPAGSDTVSMNVAYYAPFTPLSDANVSNWLSLNSYDTYLYATLRVAAEYIDDEALEDRYDGKFVSTVEDLHQSQKRARNRGGAMKRVAGGGTRP